MMMETITRTFKDMLDSGDYVYPADIDEATQALITEWFQLRHVCSDINFKIYMDRKLGISYQYYRQLLRIDPTTSDFDWLIENYNESQTLGKVSDSTTTDGTVADNSKIVYDSKTSGTHTDSATDSTHGMSEGVDRNKGFSRTAPMSVEYTAADMNNTKGTITNGTDTISYGGDMANPSIQNPTTATDNLIVTGNVDRTSGTASSSGSTSSSHTGNDSTTRSGTNHSEVGHNSDNLVQNISSGRTQSIADILAKSRAYILSSRAWDYLYRQLDTCFMCVYNEDEY